LLESSELYYGGAMRIQRDRLALSSWLRELVEADIDGPLVRVGQGGRDQLLMLCDNLEALEVRLKSYPSMSDTLDKEMMRQRSAAEEVLGRLNEIRTEIASLERNSDAARGKRPTNSIVSKGFSGVWSRRCNCTTARINRRLCATKMDGLRSEIELLQRTISEAEIRRKLGNALGRIESTVSRLVPQLDAEWPDAPVRLIRRIAFSPKEDAPKVTTSGAGPRHLANYSRPNVRI
jgi:hypothetical protein